MIKNFLSLNLFMLMLFTIVSCGGDTKNVLSDDAYTKTRKEKEIKGQFATCDLDTEALGQILTRDVSKEITCLEQNLNLFIKVVKTEEPGYLSYKKLSEFITQMMDNVDEGTINALGGIFDLAELLFAEEKGYIKQSNVKPLVTLLIELNRIFVKGDVYNLFTTTEVVSFYEHNKRKSQVYRSFKELGKVFRNHFVSSDNNVDLLKFLLRFESLGNEGIIENAKCLLFLKKAVLGGDPGILSAQELKRAANLFPDFSKVIYDFVNIPDTKADAYLDEEMIKIYRQDILTAKKNFYYADSPDEVIFTYEDIKQLVIKFFPDVAEYFKYKDSILKAKKVFFKTSSEDFTSAEVMILLDEILLQNFDRGVHFYKYYSQNRKSLQGLGPVRYGYDLNTFVDFQKESDYMFNFNRIVKNYHFFLGDQYLPTFNYDYNRNARGIFEASVLEEVVTKFFKAYGSEDEEAVFGYSLTMEQLEQVMVEFTEIFEGEGWITEGRTASTSETITLMTSLFFAQSDGDEQIEVPEFTEFIISMLGALQISTDIYSEIGKYCELSDSGTYTGQCFRDSFKEILKISKKEKSIAEYVPELDKYVSSLSDKKLDKYLTKIATFSRTCPYFKNGEEREMTEGDGLVTIAGILAIEQSVLRFDTKRPKVGDRNYDKMFGVLTPKELDAAYEVYGPAVEALAPDFMKSKAKRLYQYILKHQKVPADFATIKGFKQKLKATRDGLHLLNFVYAPWVTNRKRKSNADRMTFASVLKIIADNSPATLQMLEEDPEFCERMRDN